MHTTIYTRVSLFRLETPSHTDTSVYFLMDVPEPGTNTAALASPKPTGVPSSAQWGVQDLG